MSWELVPDAALERLRAMVARAQEQLSDAQAEYMREKARVTAMQADLFERLRDLYERRDTLLLYVRTRRSQLEALRRRDAEEVAKLEATFQEEKERVHRDYDAAASAMTGQRKLEPEQKAEIARLWKKLVKLYHPDRFAAEPSKQETYHLLMTVINKAKESGDLEKLRSIAEDPHGFLAAQGWVDLEFTEEAELEQLQKLHRSLLREITDALDALAVLRASEPFQLCLRCDLEVDGFARVSAALRAKVQAECVTLEGEAAALAMELIYERARS